MRSTRALPVAILSLLLVVAMSVSASPAPPDRAQVAEFYSYDSSVPLNDSVTPLRYNQHYTEYDVSYQSEGETVYARYYLPNKAGSSPMSPVPAIVGIHGMGSGTELQFWTIADFLAKRGIALLTPSLPFHHRRSSGIQFITGQRLIIGPPDAIRDNFRRAVIDARRAVDWLEGRCEIDSSSISMAGVSLGGIIASLAYKVEPRFSTGEFVVAGSGVGGIFEHSDVKFMNIVRTAAHLGVIDSGAYLDTLQIVDPINVPDLRPRPVLLMNGTADIIMTVDEAVRLKQSLPQAEQVWTDAGHYFPMYAAQFLAADFIAEHLPGRLKSEHSTPGLTLDAGDGHRYSETIRQREVGANQLWVDISVEVDVGRSGSSALFAHALAVPMANRAVPAIVISRSTYESLRENLSNLPAFIYIIQSDSADELAAAFTYVAALGLVSDPRVYYIRPSAPTRGMSVASASSAARSSASVPIGSDGYLMEIFSGADLESAKHELNSICTVKTAGKAPIPIPQALSPASIRFDGSAPPSDIGHYLSETITVDRLGPIPWFPYYPHDSPRWSQGPSGCSIGP